MSWYQYVVVNDRFDDAVTQLSSIIMPSGAGGIMKLLHA